MTKVKGLALVSAAAGLAAYAAAFLTGASFLVAPAASPACAVLIGLGGPSCLAAGVVLAAWKARHAAAVLWLGAACASLGFSLGSGPYLARYFAALAALVAPQVLSAVLLLLPPRSSAKVPPPRRPRRR